MFLRFLNFMPWIKLQKGHTFRTTVGIVQCRALSLEVLEVGLN